MRRFELVEGTSRKFWQIDRDGSSFTVGFGRIGTSGQTQTKTFASDATALAEHDKLVQEKLKKGYSETGAAPAPAPAKPAPKPPPPAAAVPAPAPASPPAPEPTRELDPTPTLAPEVLWSSRATRAASSARGSFTKPSSKPDARRLRATLVARQVSGVRKDFTRLADGDAVGNALTALEDPATPLDEAGQAAAFILLAAPMFGEDDASEAFVRLWIAERGFDFALRTLARAGRLHRESATGKDAGVWVEDGPRDDLPLHWPHDNDAWRALREPLAAMDDAAYARANKDAEAVRASAPSWLRRILSAAFLVDAWIVEDAAACVPGGPKVSPQIWPLLASLSDPDATMKLVDDVLAAGASAWTVSRGMHAVRDDLVARQGTRALDSLAKVYVVARKGGVAAEMQRDLAQTMAMIRTPEAAASFVILLAHKEVRAVAADFLQTTPALAIPALAVRAHEPGDAGDAARAMLGPLVASNLELARATEAALVGPPRDAIAAALAKAGPVDEAETSQVPDVLRQPPAKAPKLPGFYYPAGFARPILRGGKALPLAALEHLGLILAASNADDARVQQVKDACTPESLASFAWDLFQAWLVAGAASKEAWAFTQMGRLGDDACARKLTPLVRAWPGEGGHARAVTGLGVLEGIGTDVALMHLHGVAQKVPFKGIKERAAEKIAAIAKARGLSPEELADRLVPGFGLDDDGSLVLDFGPRSFRVGFDELLRPDVQTAEGTRVADLPKPNKGDDAEKAKAAVETWKALKKDVRAAASIQLARLEVAMCAERRWTEEVFRAFLLGHPLLVHLVRRLVWGVYEADGKKALTGTFRVAEDRSLASDDDEAFTLPEGAAIGIAHKLALGDVLAARWSGVLGDYEILQPFPQLARETFAMTEADAAATALTRAQGWKVPTGKVLGLDARGWRRGPPQDAGVVCWYEKPVVGGRVLTLELSGIYTGAIAESPEQELGTVHLVDGSTWRRDGLHKLGELTPIAYSELVRDLDTLHPNG